MRERPREEVRVGHHQVARAHVRQRLVEPGAVHRGLEGRGVGGAVEQAAALHEGRVQADVAAGEAAGQHVGRVRAQHPVHVLREPDRLPRAVISRRGAGASARKML